MGNPVEATRLAMACLCHGACSAIFDQTGRESVALLKQLTGRFATACVDASSLLFGSHI